MQSQTEVWIGLVEVRQRPGAGILLDQNQAFVNVLALACDERDYANAIEKALGDLGFDILDIEDAEPLSRRIQNYVVDNELLKLAERARATGQPQYGPFNTWVEDD